jgi:hypothetical protein
VVVVPAAVVAHGALLVGRQRVEVLENVLDRLAVEVGAFERAVGLVDVGLMVLIVVHLHRRLVDMRLKRGVIVGQRRDLVGHCGSFSEFGMCLQDSFLTT